MRTALVAFALTLATPAAAEVVSHPSGCPRILFCGCGVSVKVFGKPIEELFAARNWFKFAKAKAAPGMVAVKSHHVMLILDANGNRATVYDPNSGHHKTQIHERSLVGFKIVNPRVANAE